MKIRITKKGLPKAQWLNSQPGVQLQLPAGSQPNFAWMTSQQMQNYLMPAAPQTLPVNNTSLPPDVIIPRNLYPAMTDAEMAPPEVLDEQNQASQPVDIAATLGIGPKREAWEIEQQKKYDTDPKYALKFDDSVGFGMLQSYMDPKGLTSRKDLKKYVNFFNNKYGTKLKMPTYNPGLAKTANAVSTGIGALAFAGNAIDYLEANKKGKEWERFFRQRMMEPAPNTEFEGIENINSGRMFENMLPKPNQGRFDYGGIANNMFDSMKIRITSAPESMEYGGQSNFGLDLGRRKIYTDMPESQAESVTSSVGAVPRAMANIEAEGGETVFGDMDGDGSMEHMNIVGKRHHNGGVPLNVPEGSFIFSDTAKMRIKDPAVLAMFGKTVTKGNKGYTPAEIAKQYNINKYKAVMEDPNADHVAKATAQLMVNNYRKKLGGLALIQEEMKGFPQGIPQVAEAAIDKPMMAKFGGYLPEYQKAGQAPPVVPEAFRVIPLSPEVQAALAELANRQNPGGYYGQNDPGRYFGQNTAVSTSDTKSPQTLADMSDPEFQKYMDLIAKYDTKKSKDYRYVNSMTDADAKEFARLATKFGFKRKDDSGKEQYRVVQGATPDYNFTITGDDGKPKKIGFFGGYRPQQYERRVVEDVLGEDAVKNMSELDIRKAYFKELGVDVSGISEDKLKDAKKLYNDADFFRKTFYPKFTQRFGKDDYRSQFGDDLLIGAEHYDAYRQKQKPQDTTVIGYICKGVADNGAPIVESSSFRDEAALAAAGASKSYQVAIMNCGKDTDIDIDIIPGKKRKSSDFLTPDKLTLMAAAAIPPKGYFPFVSDMPFRPGQLALEDWLSQAQNIQQGYNTSANMLGTYNPGTAMATNLSFLAGQAGDQTAQAISQVGSRNVDRFNQFANTETQRRQNVDAYNTSARDRRWDGYTVTKQNLDNARRRYLNTVTKAANNMWANRMYLDMINSVNPFFNVDPRSGLSYFTNDGYTTKDLGRTGSGSGGGIDWSEISRGFQDAKNKFPGLTEEQYLRMTNPRTTSVDTNRDGLPDRTSTVNMGPMSYMSQMLPMYMAMSNIARSANPFTGE